MSELEKHVQQMMDRIESLERGDDMHSHELRDIQEQLQEIREELGRRGYIEGEELEGGWGADSASGKAKVGPGRGQEAVSFSYQPPSPLEEADALEHEDWEEALEILDNNLYLAGVFNEHAKSLGAFLYAAYLNKVPVLLCGPNGADIADGFSAALCGEEAGTLSLKKGFEVEDMKEALSSFTSVVKVEHALDGLLTGRIPELLRSSDRFFIFLHPFAEDIQMEPKGLWSYVLPLFTETFVERLPERGYESGKPGEDFLEYGSGGRSKSALLKLKRLHMTPLVHGRMQQIAQDISQMLMEDTMDASFLYCTMPYAFASMQAEKVLEEVKESEVLQGKISKKALSEAEFFYGATEG